VGIAASENELRDAARRARESVVVADAVRLARWIGTGRRPVTAAQVLRKADIPAAGAALGVEVPPRGTETPLAGLVALLAEFGAVTGDPGKPMITPLGRWAAGRLPEGLPGLADPGLPRHLRRPWRSSPPPARRPASARWPS